MCSVLANWVTFLFWYDTPEHCVVKMKKKAQNDSSPYASILGDRQLYNSKLMETHKYNPALRFSLVFALIVAVGVIARAELLPSFPNPPVWADTEAEFEASFEPFNGSQNEFKITLDFNASSSNNLQVGVWSGAANCGEPEAVVGWDCGKVFVEYGGARGVGVPFPGTGRLSISLTVRLSVEGKPIGSIITANGTPVEFFDADGSQVVFGFSTGWNSARAFSRGAGGGNERVSFGFAIDPVVLIIR